MKTADEIERWVVEQLSSASGFPPSELDVDAPFATFGMSSSEMVTLSGDLEQWLGRSVSPTIAWECPTVSALARRLAEETKGGPISATSDILARKG
jgi:acyl carrier protein